MFLSRNPHTWRNGTRRIAPEAVERGAFLPAQPFGPAPLHSSGDLQRHLRSLWSGEGCEASSNERARFCDRRSQRARV
jgi:hypothetical protein